MLIVHWTAVAASSRLPLPTQVRATFTQQVLDTPGQQVDNFTFYIDIKTGSARLDPYIAPLPHCQIHVHEWFSPDSAYYIEGGICRQFPGFSSRNLSVNSFAAYANAEPSGEAHLPWYGPQMLATYSFGSHGDHTNGTYFVDESGSHARIVRVELVSHISLPGAKPHLVNLRRDFQSFDTSPLAPDTFKLPRACLSSPTRCHPERSAAEAALNVTMYLAHPLNETGKIANQDTGDLLGDTAFLCFYTAPGGHVMDDYNAVSGFTVEVDSRWGAYSPCNGYPGQCLGLENRAVGREISSVEPTCKPLSGQCSDNSHDFGSWFSLPAGGECAPGQNISAGQCTWKILRRHKTIDLGCLVKHGFQNACQVDRGPPYAKSKAVFVAAFQSADPAAGGCPALQPPLRAQI